MLTALMSQQPAWPAVCGLSFAPFASSLCGVQGSLSMYQRGGEALEVPNNNCNMCYDTYSKNLSCRSGLPPLLGGEALRSPAGPSLPCLEAALPQAAPATNN